MWSGTSLTFVFNLFYYYLWPSILYKTYSILVKRRNSMPRRCITVLPDNLQFRIGQRTADSGQPIYKNRFYSYACKSKKSENFTKSLIKRAVLSFSLQYCIPKLHQGLKYSTCKYCVFTKNNYHPGSRFVYLL